MPTRRDFLKSSALAFAAGLAPIALAPLAAGQQSPAPGEGRIHPGTGGVHSLRAHAHARALLVGCAVAPLRLEREPAYAAVVKAQANILVAENEMKWEALRPTPYRFDFGAADALAAFASANGQRMRGHNLCWHQQLPGWFEATATKENARKLLTTHIETVAGRYGGRIHSWDVVNEAIEPKDGRADGLRKSPWLDLIGSDYLEIAFRTARRVDPAALLTYNDYDIELDTPEQAVKRALVLAMVRRFKAEGVPIDAVGVQSHLDASGPKSGEGLRAFVREMKAMGLQVFVTELDVSDEKLAGSIAERDAAVAAVYLSYLDLMLAEPNVTAVLTWGISDRYTWIARQRPRPDGQPPRPLPFDADYEPTPAFFALRSSIDGRVAPIRR